MYTIQEEVIGVLIHKTTLSVETEFSYRYFRKDPRWVLWFLEYTMFHFALIHSITELNSDVLVLTSASC